MKDFSFFIPADSSLFFKSGKTGDPRLGEVCRCPPKTNPQKGDFIIAGYPDDEGITLNKGRPGARLGPDAIRQYLYKTSFQPSHKKQNLVDLGNLDINCSLAERHQRAKTNVKKALDQKMHWVGLGGGHDYGYPDGAGFLQTNEKSEIKPLILNFDAHLDVRPTDQGLSSGTPFYRLLTEKKLPSFDFYEVGIQRQCNSQKHIEWVRDLGGHIIFLEDLLPPGHTFPALIKAFENFIPQESTHPLIKKRPTFLSVDIDCFSSAYAMGCSQSWPTGFSPNELFPVFDLIYKHLDVQILGLYEVSPPLDQDGRTAKLAAQIIYHFLSHSL